MKGSVYRRCGCRDPETRRPLGQKCPDLKKRGHGGWYFRYDAPALSAQTRRRPEFGPFETKKRAEEELTAELARVGGSARSLTGVFLSGTIWTPGWQGRSCGSSGIPTSPMPRRANCTSSRVSATCAWSNSAIVICRISSLR